MRICSVEGCDNIFRAKDMCSSHYNQVKGYNEKYYKYVKKRKVPIHKTVNGEIDKSYFMTFVDVTDECWRWSGATSTNGYGVFKVEKKLKKAHRLTYEYFIGDIPYGLVIDHLCENKMCVNPFHLEAVTIEENVRRAAENRRYERVQSDKGCINGHPFNRIKTRINKSGHIQRYCLSCLGLSVASSRRKKKMYNEPVK